MAYILRLKCPNKNENEQCVLLVTILLLVIWEMWVSLHET